MHIGKSLDDEQLIDALSRGGVCVIRTDTLYGLVCRADNEEAVKKVYDLKQRDTSKSPIVLISSKDQLFDKPDEASNYVLDKVWPGAVSVILNSQQAPDWISRSNGSVAYRLPDDEELIKLIAKTGPLIAPSANPEGLAPAKNIQQAIEYFGENVDVYTDSGEVINDTPSKLIRITEKGKLEQLR